MLVIPSPRPAHDVKRPRLQQCVDDARAGNLGQLHNCRSQQAEADDNGPCVFDMIDVWKHLATWQQIKHMYVVCWLMGSDLLR